MKLKKLWIITMIISSLLYITTFSVEAADETISDSMGDVVSMDYLTGESEVVTSHPDITVDNLDLVQATYTQQGIQATVTIQVKGNIENRGKVIDPYSEDFSDFNTVNYEFILTTSEQDYSVSYSNNTGTLQYADADEPINLTSSDFSVVGNTLTITFMLTSADETYSNLSISTIYLNADFTLDNPSIVFLSDVAPNPPLTLYEAYAPNIGSIGEEIQFNASVEPLTGQPPYTYHWDFGDQSSSALLNPTHKYNKVGNFTFTFTVTDNAGTTESQSDYIIISGGGEPEDSQPNQMMLFLTILLIIIIIGVVVIVWIVRRR